MQALDADTLLLVNAVFNGFAALGWALLAVLFRIAPNASWLMAAGHCARMFALRCSVCTAGWPGWAEDLMFAFSALGTLGLLALALRRMLRLQQRWADIGMVMAASAIAVVALTLAGRPQGALLAAQAGMVVLTLLATRDVLTGAGPGLAPVPRFLMTTPFVLLAGFTCARFIVLLVAPGYEVFFVKDGRSSALMGVVWLLLTMAISVSLMGLLIRRLVLRVQHLTRRDPMTDTLNRRAIGEELQQLHALRERGHEFAVIVMDIDHFKQINDQHGHAAGDAALRHCVGVFRSGLRELDLLGRLGGEEFCVLLPHTSLQAAAQVAQRMRSALQASALAWRGLPVLLTASFGVVEGQGQDPRGDLALALADREVYRAKAEGRNRVCVAEQGEGNDEEDDPRPGLGGSLAASAAPSS